MSFYPASDIASTDHIPQNREHPRIGFGKLDSLKDARDGDPRGDHWRLQLGKVCSVFD